MMNWIEGNWPDAFKCIVNHNGVFDNRMMYYSTEELWFDEWENGATQYDNPEAYERFNPVNHVKRWKTPMLVIHGEKDFRIPRSEEHTSELQSLMRISYAVFCLKKKNHNYRHKKHHSKMQN